MDGGTAAAALTCVQAVCYVLDARAVYRLPSPWGNHMSPGRFVAAFAALLVSPAVSAQTSRQLVRPEGAGALPSGIKPLSEQLTVVLKLAGDPVAVVRSRLPDKKMSRADREGVADDLRGKQQAM